MLKTMYNVCVAKNKLSNIYEDENEYLINKYSYIDEYLKLNGGHFVRFENVSLKNGKHGCIPYTSFKQILESMVTSKIGQSCLR